MSLTTNEAIPEREQRRRHNTRTSIAAILVLAALWGGIVYYGFTTAKTYIDTAIQNVQQENAFHLEDLTDSIDRLRREVDNLRESIESTDSALAGSTEVQSRIDEKLRALDNQLQELEQSLRILKEAP
ncbi:MAG: hypothetical protein ACOX8W_11940 [bacterium]|jgi:predicted nuclease with TOPRIM domain